MKIAYISEQDPFNIGLWSGTPFHIIKALKKQHDVVWIGGGKFNGVMWHQKFLENPHPRFVHDYSPEIDRVLSKELKDRNIDIVVSSNYVLCSHLDSDIPFIYFNDIVFSVCEGFFFKPNPDFKYKAKKREEECLRRADAINFTSEQPFITLGWSTMRCCLTSCDANACNFSKEDEKCATYPVRGSH